MLAHLILSAKVGIELQLLHNGGLMDTKSPGYISSTQACQDEQSKSVALLLCGKVSCGITNTSIQNVAPLFERVLAIKRGGCIYFYKSFKEYVSTFKLLSLRYFNLSDPFKRRATHHLFM